MRSPTSIGARARLALRRVTVGVMALAAAGLVLVAPAVGTLPLAAAAPSSWTAYVANHFSASVTPIDTATNTPNSAIPVENGPSTVAITPNGQTAYVANTNSDSVTPIDIATNTPGKPIPVSSPVGIAITPDGQTAYVTNFRSTTVTPIDTVTNLTEAPIDVGSGPVAVAITPNGQTAYVVNTDSNNVTPIVTATNAPGTPIPVGTAPIAVAITSNGQTAYVVNRYSPPIGLGPGTVTPIDTANDTPANPITVGSNPEGIAITPNGQTAYVANRNPGGSGNVTPIDIANNTLGDPITVGDLPTAVAITPDQAPVAKLSVTPNVAGQPSSFDASASTVAFGTIATYSWNFGDGTTTITSSPTTTHTYLTPGTYSASVTETSSGGTSTTKVFTGQTMSQNGGPQAVATQPVTVETNPTPQITKSFGATSIPLGGETTLSFTITNPNASTALSGIGFTDPLPSGLAVATPDNGLSGSCDGGTIVATPGSSSISLSGATLAGSSSCQFEVGVIGIAPGNQVNTTSAVTSNVGDGPATTASLQVSGCPDGQTAYLLTATTNVGTIYGGFCVNPDTGEGTYQQQGTSGVGQVNSNAGTTEVTAQGTNLALQGKLALPFYNSFTEQQPLQASGKFSVVAPVVTHLYWANAGSGTIMEANLDGTGATEIVSGQDFPQGVAVDSSHIYWANSISGTIMEANLDGTGVTELVGGQSVPFGVAVDSNHIYWASPPSGHLPSGAIWEANLDGTSVTEIVGGQSFPTGMAVDSSHIYWANFDSGTIREANLDGTNVTEIVNSQSAPTGVAVGPP